MPTVVVELLKSSTLADLSVRPTLLQFQSIFAVLTKTDFQNSEISKFLKGTLGCNYPLTPICINRVYEMEELLNFYFLGNAPFAQVR